VQVIGAGIGKAIRRFNSDFPWDEAKKRMDVLSPIVTMTAIMVGGGYALFQYSDHAQAERAKESFTFVERYYKPPIVDAQLSLSTVWNRHAAALNEAREKDVGAPYTAFILDVIAKERLETQIFTMTGFYEGIGLCTKHGWCDKNIVAAFFCDRAREFFQLHVRFLGFKRHQWSNPKLAAETEEFVQRECPKRASGASAQKPVH
jgi:hypothetical protein